MGKLTYHLGCNWFKTATRNRLLDLFCFNVFVCTCCAVLKIFKEYTSLMLLFQTTMPLTISSQAMIRIFFALWDSEPYVKLRSMIEVHYDKNEKFEEDRKAMRTCLGHIVKAIYFFFTLNVFCIFGPLAFSLYKTIETGQSTVPYPIIFPFIDFNSTVGFILNFSFHSVLTCYAIPGFGILDAQTFMYVRHTQVFVQGLSFKLQRLSTLMTATDESKLKDRQKVRKSLHEIFEAHEELVAYCDWLHKFSSRLAFVIVTFNTYAFCSSSILILTSNFYGGIGFIFQSFVTLLTFCSMGALVRIQHERLLDAIWKFEWYKLPLADQKDWLNFMTKAQKPLQVETIFIGIIDLELFIKVSANVCFRIKSINRNSNRL